MIKGVAFDLEGTVVDVEKAHHKAHLAAAADVGVNLTFDQALEKIVHFIGGPDDRVAEEIWELSDKHATPEEIFASDKKYYEQFLESLPIAPREEFLKFFQHVQDNGLKASIGSLTGTAQAKVLLEHSGLKKIFPEDMIVLREHVTNLKPAPDVFIETAKRMGITPQEQLVFEDSPRGIQAALAAGSKAIGMPVYHREDTIQALKTAGASFVFLSWKDIDLETILQAL